MIKAIFFDLDGTLLPLKDDDFYSTYIKLLVNKLKDYGYEPNRMVNNIKTLMNKLFSNDGSKTCKEVFYELFYSEYGDKVNEDEALYNSFYKNEFKELKLVCKENKDAKELIKNIKNKVNKVVLATNSLLPYEAIKTRLSFIDLNENDFDYISKYEILHHTKPNPNYFKEILNDLNLNPNEVIMFGNNAYEDAWCANSAGIKTYLVDLGYIIYPEHVKEKYEIISFSDIEKVIDNELELNK